MFHAPGARMQRRPLRPSGIFVVSRAGVDQTGLSVGAFNKWLFTTAGQDPKGWVDTDNAKIILREPGWYLVGFNIQTVHDAASDGTVAAIYQNGASAAEGGNLSSYTSGVLIASNSHVSAIVRSNGEDEFEFYAYNAGTSGFFKGLATRSYAWGYKIAHLF